MLVQNRSKTDLVTRFSMYYYYCSALQTRELHIHRHTSAKILAIIVNSAVTNVCRYEGFLVTRIYIRVDECVYVSLYFLRF